MTPDLDNPMWQLLLIAAVMWLVLALVWAHDRHKRRRVLRAGRPPLRSASPLPVDRDEPADRHRMVHRYHGGGRSADRDRIARVAEQARLDLTDEELVALARYLDATARRRTDQPLPVAAVRVLNAASDVLHDERVNRRG